MRWYRTRDPATTPDRHPEPPRGTPTGPPFPAAYHRRHAARPRHRQHEHHDRASSGPARSSPRDAPRRTPARRPTRSSCSSTGCCASTASRPPTSTRSRSRRSCRRSPARSSRSPSDATVRSSSRAPARCRWRSGWTGRARWAPIDWSTRWPPPGCTARPAVVVDFGTATTLDCVAADGAYVGGAIAPGLELGLEALAARTAKLPRIELRAPDRAIGRDTVSAMQAGTIFGYQALAAGLLERVRPSWPMPTASPRPTSGRS